MVYLNPANLPENDLAQALFENTILHAQNFVRRIQDDKSMANEALSEMASQISEYALAIMTFYFFKAGRGDLQKLVIKKSEDFFIKNCGLSDESVCQIGLNEWRQEIQRKMAWLSLGNNTANLDSNIFVRNILSDQNLQAAEMDRCRMRPQVDQFVCDIQTSMKHFGIVD